MMASAARQKLDTARQALLQAAASCLAAGIPGHEVAEEVESTTRAMQQLVAIHGSRI